MKWALCIAALVMAGPASAHDFWINHGNYTSPDGVHCCGLGDCTEIPGEAVSAGPHGYTLILGEIGKQVLETVPYSEAQPSEDGKYWRCKRYDGTRRCFFAPAPSF